MTKHKGYVIHSSGDSDYLMFYYTEGETPPEMDWPKVEDMRIMIGDTDVTGMSPSEVESVLSKYPIT